MPHGEPTWTFLHPRADLEMLGFLPSFLHEADLRPAREQLDENYAHGGGWSPMSGWRMISDARLKYPGDPPLSPVAMTKLRDETLYFYPGAFVAIVQPCGEFEVARMD